MYKWLMATETEGALQNPRRPFMAADASRRVLLSLVPEGSFEAALKLAGPADGLGGVDQRSVTLARLVVRQQFVTVGFKPLAERCVVAQQLPQVGDPGVLVHASATR